jgi:CHAD domain-containing protein
VTEREIKLGAAMSFRLPALDGIVEGVDVTPGPAHRVSATYLDTDDLRLTRWGVSLRHRSSDGWTLKLPKASTGTLLVREELVFGGDRRRPPAEAVDLVRAFVRTATLRPQVRLRTIRQQTLLHDDTGRPVADVVDDQVAVLDGRKISMRFHELEVEIADETQPALLEALIGRLREYGAGPPDPTPKVVRALGARASDPPEVLIAGLGVDATTADIVRRALASSVDRLIRHDPVVRLDADPEGVHQARVATRRLRSDLRTFRSLLDPDWTRALRDELAWLAESLGAVRDADVLLARIESRAGELPQEDRKGADRIRARLRAARARAYDELVATLRGERYLVVLDRLIDAANTPAFLNEAESAGSAVLPPLVRRPLRRLARRVEALADRPTDEELHVVRIRTKRARYAAEAAVPVLGKPARAVAAAAADLQDVLGEHRDAVVAERWLRAQARRSRSVATAFVAGQLAVLERAAAERARARWRKAWKKLSKTRSKALT